MKQRNCERGNAQVKQLKNGHIKYMYRTRCNEIFTCTVANVDEAIAKRDNWLREIEAFNELKMVQR